MAPWSWDAFFIGLIVGNSIMGLTSVIIVLARRKSEVS